MRIPTLLLVIPAVAFASTIEKNIPNPLNDLWPLEHISMDFPAGELREPVTVAIQGVKRPGQIERVQEGSQSVDRLWTIATILGRDENGEPLENPSKNPALKNVKARIESGVATPSALSLKEEGDYFLIQNGPYQAKIRNYSKSPLKAPTRLEDLPHWLGGILVANSSKWDARAHFEGPTMIREAKTEILAQGPVHVDLKITLTGDEQAPTAQTEAIPLRPGKQSFRFEPDEIPREKVPAYQVRYEAVLRFVLDDPWIDVSERAHLPRDQEIKPWGFNQYVITMGGQEGQRFDTAMWVRWFEWDIFGGNVEVVFAPAEMREAQKGRPFAMLRPVWNQGGGGAQDFFLTSGGATPKANAPVNPATGYSPENPAIGVVAAFPSKWVGPFAQTIVARAENGDSGNLRLPLVPADVEGLHYGQRAYGLCAGPRDLFDTTGKLNGLVRRHVDWTLNALINRYLLEWPRDTAKAGPNLLITRARLKKIQEDFQSGKETPETAALREEWPRIERQMSELETLRAEIKERDAALKELPEDQRASAKAAFEDLREKARTLDRSLNSDGSMLIRLLAKGDSKAPDLMRSDLFRERRYQDDFLNPTSPPIRRMLGFRFADLMANGTPLGGAEQAALGYIATDPDYWMGWKNGWMPGNPNFHTDKYAAALYVGGLLRDHPHANDWIEFAKKNYLRDLDLVLLPPDGVGVECPGYSGYALSLLLPMGRSFENLGLGNLLGKNPMVKNTGLWHRHLLTPVDVRIGRRHEAPIGDTHRWDSGLGQGFGALAGLFRTSDPDFATDMMTTWQMLEASGVKGDGSPASRTLLTTDGPVPVTDPKSLDWKSRPWFGFGATMRNAFGTPRESFVSYKAGRIRGHYHNDENSYHFYSSSTPISLDYNCSYTPRGDHAALHNSMTFGKEQEVNNNKTGKPVAAMEQLLGSAAVGAFVSRPEADVVVSELKGSKLVASPVDPGDAEFARDYPSREVSPIVHRRFLILVKHPEGSPLCDYLVVRDETQSREPQQLNIHLLAQDLKIAGPRISARGQLDKDMIVHLAEATNPRISDRQWYYADEWMFGPEEYWIREGESHEAWDKRMEERKKKDGRLPLAGFQPRRVNANRNEAADWLKHLAATEGRALIPPTGWQDPWTYGEYQKWARIETDPGTPVLWALAPYQQGQTPPEVSTIPGGVRIAAGGVVEEIFADSAGGVRIVKNGQSTPLIAPGALPPLGSIQDSPLKEGR